MSVVSPTPPPGPRGRLLLEELRILQKDPLRFLTGVVQRYGDFVRFGLGPVQVIVLNHPDAARHVLLDNHRNYTKNTFQYNQLATITGRGLLTSDGETWLRQRRLAQPAFHRARIAALGDMMAAAAARMVSRWEPVAQAGRPLDIDAEMMHVALEIVGRALFRVDLSGEAQELAQATLTALDTLIYRSRNPFGAPAFLPTPRNRRFRQAVRTLDARVYSLIRERRQSPAEGAGGAAAGADLLDMLLAARDSDTGAGMDDRQLRDEMITLLIAGHETVASALTWTWYLLAQHPAAWARLSAELASALGGRLPTAADLPNLPFTQMVFDESLRLYPPAWIITRQAVEADRTGGCRIPARALVVISPYTMHRHPGFWEDPLAFDPGRFSPERAAARPRFAYLPFGGGPRLCIGDSFARAEAALVLATVARRFRPALLPGQEVHLEALVTLRPRGGLPMRLIAPDATDEKDRSLL